MKVLTSKDAKIVYDPENFDSADVEYTGAIVNYKNWKFVIGTSEKLSCNPGLAFEIKVSCKRLDGYTTLDSSASSLHEAMEKVKDFINNELQ